MNFSDFKKIRQSKFSSKREERVRRPSLTKQEERFLYSIHLKTIENRTLLATLKASMTPTEYNTFLVEYSLRLMKAKKNFEKNNFKDEWWEEGVSEDE